MAFSCDLDFSQYSLWVPRGSVPRLNVPRSRRQKLQGQFRAMPRTGMALPLLYSTGQSNHRPHSHSTEKKIELYILMRKRHSHIAEESRDGRHCGTDLGKIQPATLTRPAKYPKLDWHLGQSDFWPWSLIQPLPDSLPPSHTIVCYATILPSVFFLFLPQSFGTPSAQNAPSFNSSHWSLPLVIEVSAQKSPLLGHLP